MPQLTPGQARIVDQVLTQVAQGFKQPNLVGSALFPVIDVDSRGGQIVTFGREEFMVYSNIVRAPGQNTPRLQVGYLGSPYALQDISLEGVVPSEIRQEQMNSPIGPHIDGAKVTLYKIQAALENNLERNQAALATNAANYGASNKITLAGTSQWSDQTTGVSSPIANIETAREAIRSATGQVANTVVMGASVWSKLKTHPLVIDRMKYTGAQIPTEEMVAQLFDVERVLVGRALTSNDAATAFTDVWGKFVVVAYTTPMELADLGAPTFGYTYNLRDYPLVEEPYVDRNAKGWVVPVTRAEQAVIASPGAGYLISAAVA